MKELEKLGEPFENLFEAITSNIDDWLLLLQGEQPEQLSLPGKLIAPAIVRICNRAYLSATHAA